MVRALLTHRNTPDVGCKLSPAQILLGRPLRDTLPFLQKEIMCFNSPQVHSQWRESWKLKENALRERYVKTLENLSEHTRTLPPLRHGDRVLIQNQRGRYPTKWDHSGTIVETKPNDQYVVKVSGSGRLTLRNRRFLRRFQCHDFHGTHFDERLATPSATPVPVANVPSATTAMVVPLAPPQHVVTPERSSPPPVQATPITRSRAESQQPKPTPTRLSFGSVTPSMTDMGSPQADVPTPPVVFSPRRSTRSCAARKTYDANTGTDGTIVSVPEEI